MSGPTLTVTALPTAESTQSFPSSSHSPSRSRSSTDLLSGPESFRTQSPLAASSHNRSSSAVSLPSLPTFDVPSFDFGTDFDTTFSFSNDLLKGSTNEKPTAVNDENNMAGPEPRISKTGKRRTPMSRPQSWMPSLHIAENADDVMDKDPIKSEDASNPKFLNPNPQETYRTVSDSLASLAKRSWIPGSRSPSPGEKKNESEAAPEGRLGRERSASNSSIMKLRRSSRKRPISPAGSDSSKSTTESLGKIGSYLNRFKQRQPGILAKGKNHNDRDSPASSTASLAPPSTETRQSHASETSNSTFPEDSLLPKMPQARDPLWSTFKALDSDSHRFQTKSTGLKIGIVRGVLMPFLRSYANHSSNKMLHYEDLERRALILNKWWGGLLELLEAKNQPPIPGVDKPILFEALTALMMRPEWRQCTINFCPVADRTPAEQLRRSRTKSASSLDSTDSAYIADSAKHNVKTMFITNLVAQVSLVVDKLSIRHAPLSLVNFAGKACAYAFFFAPGIADMLVRLWELSPDRLRRVADGFGLPRDSQGESNDIVTLFPHCVEKLGWTSTRALSYSLRQDVVLPLTSSKIAWRGPWVSRWVGRDTDLFFIFCKYYYILAEEFMPKGLPFVEKARAPGFVLVNAQVLTILDSTVHRQAALEASIMGPPLADAAHGADATAMALPIPLNNNIMKGMSENRLVVLLKDLLSSVSVLHVDARHTFAESFIGVMKAAAKRTSQFDHGACFTICDFLEESLVVYDEFMDIHKADAAYVDWPFWFEVCKKISESNNTMSEIRVLSLIFSIWETIANDQSRKEKVCLEWLLTEETFNKLFNNWCPMVRAYYMRLLCWRICRDAGSANSSDAEIFLVVYSRLKTVWSHYLWLKHVSEEQGKFPPSTAPSFPTPGKRFMIIRTEIPVAQPGLMMSFDSSTPLSPHSDPATTPATDFESMDTVDAEPSFQKKRGSLLGKLFSFTGSSANDLEAVRRETAASRIRPNLPPKGPIDSSPTGSDSDSMGSSPTYEALQYVFKFTLSWNAAGTMSPPNRILTRPRLPSPAQSWVTAKGRTGSPPPPAAGRPAPTRAVSGSPNPGLVDSAKNADPSEVPSPTHRIPMTFDRRQSLGQMSPIDKSSDDLPFHSPVSTVSRNRDGAIVQSPVSLLQEPIIMPAEPKGVFATGAKYAGRALAEWSLVVAECNSFVDRRREEGVLGLSDVEVPALGVEGFRKLA
ncbi:DUF1765-domain-containing protein [Hypoxylon trugodes]|uniref:DUF1765-domain-containing protein n=1 Tax=Hypoxylon trugodes TaxID=326681 RepID=UPI00219C6C03|nr:DUF1765-domain-containing protein [Hypoxylon trugodes]KAI1386747.1 DUF1765-domain-containing protein [Hypoxylon trugodes]